MSRIGIALRCLVLAGAFLVLVPVQWLASRIGARAAGRVPVLFHRLFLRLFHVRVSEIGRPAGATATLVLANHVSWLDIPVLGSLRPLAFVAKQEVAGWPLVGTLARLQRCIFVDRTRKAATAQVNALVGRRMQEGGSVVLFPEGTTGDGIRTLPFRSSLVGAARAALARPDLASVRLQPLAISYRGRAGLPLTRRDLPAIAWYGDMDLLPHLGGFVRGGPLDVVAVWGEPMEFDRSTDRKRAAAVAEASVRSALRGLAAGAILNRPPSA